MSSMVITEKPSQNRQVEAAVGSTYGPVLPAKGHIVEPMLPEEYDPAWRSWGTQLLLPREVRYPMRPEESGKPFLARIKAALKGVTTIYISTDPDREGQVIGQAILEYLGYKGKVMRVMPLAVDPVSIRKAFVDAVDNAAYQGMYEAGVARLHGDQIFNLSMTRAASVSLRKSQDSRVIGIGRVKTPTMGLVCRRELEILEFKPVGYFEVEMAVASGAAALTLTHAPREDARILDRTVADAIAASARAFDGPLAVATERKRQAPPRLLDLTGVAKAAAGWGWSAAKAEEVLQELYETHQLATYPRSEAKSLPEAMIPEAGLLLGKLSGVPALAALVPATPTIRRGKGAMYSDKDLEGMSHYAIIPNLNCPTPFAQAVARLSPDEARLFEHVARTFVAGVSGDMVYDQTKVRARVAHGGGSLEFATSGRVVLEAGWRAALPPGKDEDEVAPLPKVADGAGGRATGSRAVGKTTKAPPRYNEATLFEAMENAWKFSDDPVEREKLKESKGIGRPSSRKSVVGGLVKQRLLEGKGKAIVPTEAGLALYKVLKAHAPLLVDVGSTARMEMRLDEVVLRKAGCDEVIREMADVAARTIPQIVAASRSVRIDTGSRDGAPPWKQAAKGAKPGAGTGAKPAARATGAGAVARGPGTAGKSTPGKANPGRIYFAVDFAKKDVGKGAGLRWDPDASKWYAPSEAEAKRAAAAGLSRA